MTFVLLFYIHIAHLLEYSFYLRFDGHVIKNGAGSVEIK